jgi:S1-C subfamily serine protease
MNSRTVELARDLRQSALTVLCFPEVTGQVSVEDLVQRMNATVARGTAFAVTADRFVTCNHVIQNAQPRFLRLIGPGLNHNVIETNCDPHLDVALLRTERVEGDVVPIPFEPGPPLVGLDILAVGYPFPEQRPAEVIQNEHRINVNAALTFRAIRGIIASRLPDGLQFEIDKHVNPGQSGGPVVSIETGRLVGMCRQFRWFQQQDQPRMAADLGVCLGAEAIRGKLNEWGVPIQ